MRARASSKTDGPVSARQLKSLVSTEPAPSLVSTAKPKGLVLFNYDWDVEGYASLLANTPWASPGFDLFSFPSNARLIGFDIDKWTDRLARRYPKLQWVVSNNEQFGALAAAVLAQKIGLPGTDPKAIVACQHKWYARQMLAEVAPEATVPFALLPCEYGQDMPHHLPQPLRYPAFVKPVKAAFSVLAKTVHDQAELQQHTRFGWRELWVIKRLVEPFDRVAKRLIPGLPPAHRLLLEHPTHLESPTAQQFNLDGFVHQGKAEKIGVVDAVMYPGTQAFMRFDYPSQLPEAVQKRALAVAGKFLAHVGFTHGIFNMEFFHDAATDRITVIEFNPRMASQMADLYKRVDGLDLYAMSLALAQGLHPGTASRARSTAGAASSFVYRSFAKGTEAVAPSAKQLADLVLAFPDALVLPMPKAGHSLDRDYTWLGSHRYGILHLGGQNADHLRTRCERASSLLGWPAPYAELHATASKASANTATPAPAPVPTPACTPAATLGAKRGVAQTRWA